MKDLFVNFIGAIVFCIFGYFYLTKGKKAYFIKNFVPIKGRRKLPRSVERKLKQMKHESN